MREVPAAKDGQQRECYADDAHPIAQRQLDNVVLLYGHVFDLTKGVKREGSLARESVSDLNLVVPGRVSSDV